jgi:hypothetical protein
MEELRANMIEAILLVQESIKEEAELRHEQITEVIVKQSNYWLTDESTKS